MLAKLSVDQMLMKAKSFEKKGEFVEAEKLYNNILENFKNNHRAYFRLENLKKIKKNNINLKISPQEEIYELERLYNLGKFSRHIDGMEYLGSICITNRNVRQCSCCIEKSNFY